MIKLAPLFFATATLTASASAFGAAPSCDGFTKHVVTIMAAEFGEDSMFEKGDIPALVKACEKVKNLPKEEKAATCIMKAKDTKTMDKCPTSPNKIMKPWMEHMG
jgi:hypothetical protein